MFKEEKVSKDKKILIYNNKIFVEFYSHQKNYWIVYSIRKDYYSSKPYFMKRIFKLKNATPENINKFIEKLKNEKSLEYNIDNFFELKAYLQSGYSYKIFKKNIEENLGNIIKEYSIYELNFKNKPQITTIKIISKKYLPGEIINEILEYINKYRKMFNNFPDVISYRNKYSYLLEDLYTIEIQKVRR